MPVFCRYCDREVGPKPYIRNDLVFCDAPHADLYDEREEIVQAQNRIRYDGGLQNYRKETRRQGCTPQKRS